MFFSDLKDLMEIQWVYHEKYFNVLEVPEGSFWQAG